MAMTLRLNSDQERELGIIQKRLGTKTASGTLKKMILGHSDLVQKLSVETRKAKEVTEELIAIKAELKAYFDAKNNLSERVKS